MLKISGFTDNNNHLSIPLKHKRSWNGRRTCSRLALERTLERENREIDDEELLEGGLGDEKMQQQSLSSTPGLPGNDIQR